MRLRVHSCCDAGKPRSMPSRISPPSPRAANEYTLSSKVLSPWTNIRNCIINGEHGHCTATCRGRWHYISIVQNGVGEPDRVRVLLSKTIKSGFFFGFFVRPAGNRTGDLSLMRRVWYHKTTASAPTIKSTILAKLACFANVGSPVLFRKVKKYNYGQ
jgi:hypothetical protein